MPLKIYIAGPYSSGSLAHVRANVHVAIDAGIEVIARGHQPFIPHLTYYVDAQAQDRGVDFGYECWMELDFAWLACCDALLFLGHSPGADRELAWAETHGLRVFHETAEIPPVEVEA